MRFWLAFLLLLTVWYPLQSHAQGPVRSASEAFSVKKLLKQNEAVVVLRERAGKLELLILGTAHERVVPLSVAVSDMRKSLEKLDGNIRSAVDAVPPPPFDIEAANQLAASLSLQTLREIPLHSTLIFVSQLDGLRDIPFHVLPINNDPISQSYDIAVVPSLDSLRASLQRRQSPLAAQIGTPTYSDKLGAAIANNEYLRFPYMTVFSEAAKEAFVKENLPKASLILLAPHGWYDEADPSRSFLAFVESERDDGRLHAYEARTLRLKPGLVFVGSCDLGRRLMLPDLLLKAGTSTVIASYWSPTLRGPSSWITAKVMEHLSKGKGAAFAVTEAQREMMALIRGGKKFADYSHPAYWAPFVAIGNWR
ncbi:MAG: CHAT domain-containing protein [Rhodospirillales bacterium]|nr:CHAT domain-containing protein [Rhodospirillales bacterium]